MRGEDGGEDRDAEQASGLPLTVDGVDEITGRYLVVEPPHRLVFTWQSPASTGGAESAAGGSGEAEHRATRPERQRGAGRDEERALPADPHAVDQAVGDDQDGAVLREVWRGLQ